MVALVWGLGVVGFVESVIASDCGCVVGEAESVVSIAIGSTSKSSGFKALVSLNCAVTS